MIKMPSGTAFLCCGKEKGRNAILFRHPKAVDGDNSAFIAVVVPLNFPDGELGNGDIGRLEQDLFLRPIVSNYKIVKNPDNNYIYFEAF